MKMGRRVWKCILVVGRRVGLDVALVVSLGRFGVE
jgi:hypothetical protein